MLDRIKDFLKGDTSSLTVSRGGEASMKELQVATGVLLLEMAGADEDYAPEELKTIFGAMEKQFNLTEGEAMEIMEVADQMRSVKKIDEFVSSINENYGDRQKQMILAMVWKVVLADTEIQKHEQKFASQLRLRLELSREEAEEAKKLATEGKV